MPATASRTEENGLRLRLEPAIQMTDEQFFVFCQQNRDLRIERTAHGEITITPPTGGGTSNRNLELVRHLGNWAKEDGSGAAFGPDGGFVLPNGAIRAPDASWVRRKRLADLSPEEKEKFLPLCPDFVIELRSRTDSLDALKAKMQEYRGNGVRLGWLIDPQNRDAYVYRADAEPERLDDPDALRGDPLLTGFTLELDAIWTLDF